MDALVCTCFREREKLLSYVEMSVGLLYAFQKRAGAKETNNKIEVYVKHFSRLNGSKHYYLKSTTCNMILQSFQEIVHLGKKKLKAIFKALY